MTPPTIREHYADASGQASWRGCAIADGPDLRAYLTGPVRDRLHDAPQADAFRAELTGLATTDLGAATVTAVLTADGHQRQPWEIGEAMAEVLLEDHRGAVWPWNSERDKRTPKASLPGADLVGFVTAGEDDVTLAFGEVKTSSHADAPPGVMSGRSGMAHQLQSLYSNVAIRGTLLRWLHARCRGTRFWSSFETATSRYLSSGGEDFVLFGLLMRDTEPNALDLDARGRSLGASCRSPTAYELAAWHLPHRAAEWPALVEGGEIE